MTTFLQLATISAANAEKPSVHNTVILILILLIAGLALALAAPRLKLPYPILLACPGWAAAGICARSAALQPRPGSHLSLVSSAIDLRIGVVYLVARF